MNRDFLFDYFMQNTGEIREKGFRAYLASLYLFMIQILLVIAQTMDSSIRYPVLIGSTLLVSFMFKDWVKIMDLAGSMFDDSDPTMQSLDEEYKKKRGYKD